MFQAAGNYKSIATIVASPGNHADPFIFNTRELFKQKAGRYSYICVGTEQAMSETWGSTCHGAGRTQSRHAAKRMLKGVDIAQRLARQGIYVRAQNRGLLSEEASEAYKDVAEVVDVLHEAGIAHKVVRMRPIGVVKG